LKYTFRESEATVKFTVFKASEEREEREGIMEVSTWTEKVCGARFLLLTVKEWKVDVEEMAVVKEKKEVLPKTE
jgi:hypothetical protein